jgi:hypothetical protein
VEKNFFSTENMHFQPGTMNFQLENILGSPEKFLRHPAAINCCMEIDFLLLATNICAVATGRFPEEKYVRWQPLSPGYPVN